MVSVPADAMFEACPPAASEMSEALSTIASTTWEERALEATLEVARAVLRRCSGVIFEMMKPPTTAPAMNLGNIFMGAVYPPCS